ncbi:hypothetical protein F444_14913 [Phytophthora nicotianae P1976]|uniref:Core-binding (CB) domain-containing protein n=1 Tax=Phytophthora nicotianae P1976 TaxID=1317066 RepID=A0A080ZNM7_PHYNI|nr:hypothetical protein F444_14913 [Phytophthora nicotianae P1976]
MREGSAQHTSESAACGMAVADVEAIRDACVTKQTRGKYKSSLNSIVKWIRKELAKVDHNTNRFFDSSGELNLMEFTPPYFEQFLVYKSRDVKDGTLSGYRSAIKDLHRVRCLALPPEYGDGMKQLFSGMKRIEANSDQISNPKTSGKQPLTYSLYQKLCKETLELGDGDQFLFKPYKFIILWLKMMALVLQEQLQLGGSSWMLPTGIPPCIELYKNLDKQQQSIDSLPDKLEQRMEAILEKKGVAADFAFPSIDPLGAWMLWGFGNPKLNYLPFKSIPSDDLDTPQKKATLSEWSVMMRHIINGIEKDLGKPMPAIRDEAHAIELFKIGYNTLELKPSKRKRRNAQIKLTTVLRLIREAGQEQRSRPHNVGDCILRFLSSIEI